MQLRLGEPGNRIVAPEQVARFGPGVHDLLNIGAAQHQGGSARELALTDPRLAAHQQRTLGGQGRIDGRDTVAVEDVKLRRAVAHRR